MTANKKKKKTAKKDFKVLIVYPNLYMALVPAIAIGLFARIFRDQGYDVDLFDTSYYDNDGTDFNESRFSFAENRVKILNARKFDLKKDLGVTTNKSDMLQDFRRRVETFQPDFLVFSVVDDTFLQSLAMLRAVEDLDIPHLMGGVFPTFAPKRCMEAAEVRLIGPGEGEDTVLAVAEAIAKGESLDGIAGTWWKSDDGEVKKYQQRPLTDINKVIPDYSLYDKSRFMRPMGGRVFKMIPIETFRGCPYACTYCGSPSQRAFATKHDLGNFMRRKTMDMLRAEIKDHIERYDPEFVFFIDDSFLARPRQEIFDFCDMYEEFNLPFWCETRAENCDPEILSRLKEVNCYRISFGLEAGNEQYRNKVLRRKITNDEIIQRFKWIAESGIAYSLNVIIGMPGETRDLVMDTIELIRAMPGYDSLTSFIFTPYYGTTLRQVAVKNGWLDADVMTQHYSAPSLLKMPPPYLSADEIRGLMATLPLYCYFPKSEWPNLRLAEADTEEGLKIRKPYADIYTKNFLGENQDFEKIYLDGSEDKIQNSPDRMDEAALARLMGPSSPL